MLNYVLLGEMPTNNNAPIIAGAFIFMLYLLFKIGKWYGKRTGNNKGLK